MIYKKKPLQVECLSRYGAHTSSLEDVMEFLHSEGLLSKADIKSIKQSASPSKDLEEAISILNMQGKFQLLEYEWTLLPVERIKLSIVTDRSNKEFTFNY